MLTDFKVYPRKIRVWSLRPANTATDLPWSYGWSTHAYRTCRDAIAAAKKINPALEFKASFAKD
jgi:hypothetical protein